MPKSTEEETQKVNKALMSAQELDLTEIRGKLTGAPEKNGLGWEEERYSRAEMWYRRMLAIGMVFGPGVAPMHQDVDEVWHAHILHTTKYHEDCQRLFGRYLHHIPCSPSSPESTLETVRTNTKRALALYHRFFEIDPRFLSSPANCRDTCGGEVWRGPVDTGSLQWTDESTGDLQ